MVTTHLGDLKTYAFHNERAENAAVEFDVETLRPTYRLHIGQFGMSNALKIARRLKLPRDLLKRAHRYLRRQQAAHAGTGPAAAIARGSGKGPRGGAGRPARGRTAAQEEYRQKPAQMEREAEDGRGLARLRRDCSRTMRCRGPFRQGRAAWSASITRRTWPSSASAWVSGRCR